MLLFKYNFICGIQERNKMIKITVICVGKIKEKYFVEAINEYKKRLSKYVNLNIIEVPNEKAPDNLSRADEQIIKLKEAQKILKFIKDEYLIALCIDGNQQSSTEFTHFIENNMINGISHICFIIGGSLGLHNTIIDRTNFKLSFSNMTFPHQLMRVILLEQIYRSNRILSNEPYHK